MMYAWTRKDFKIFLDKSKQHNKESYIDNLGSHLNYNNLAKFCTQNISVQSIPYKHIVYESFYLN